MTIGAKTAAQAAAVNRVVHKNQMNWSSDKCQRALNTIHYPLSTAVTRSIPAPKEGCLPISLPSTRRNSARFLQNPARHSDMRYTGSNQPENAMAALTQRRRIEMYACPSYPSNAHPFDAAQPAPAATTRHLAWLHINRLRPPKGPARHTLSPLSRSGNFAAVAPMLPTVKAMSPIVDISHPKSKVDQCRQKTVKSRPMSSQCRPKPQPATSCHERPPNCPVTRRKKSSPKEGTLGDIGRLRYPIDTLPFQARCLPRPSAGRLQRTGSDPSAASPPATRQHRQSEISTIAKTRCA